MTQVATGMANADSEVASIQKFMSGFTVETTPTGAAKVNDFREILRPGATIYITFLPGSDYNDTVATAKRLRAEGFEPAPHFPARSMRDKAMVEDYLSRVTGEAGVNHVLTIAGAVDKPLGPYGDSMALLDTGLFDKYGVRQIGVAGHPEGSPDMSDEAIAAALKWKLGFAERSDAAFHIVTQFCFEAKPIIEWDRALRADGNTFPIRIGVPGIAKLSTLLKYALACGVGNSLQFLKKKSKDITKMMSQEAPDRLVRDLANYAATDPNCGIDSVHMYPLGGLQKSADWSYAACDGKFTLTKDGFKV